MLYLAKIFDIWGKEMEFCVVNDADARVTRIELHDTAYPEKTIVGRLGERWKALGIAYQDHKYIAVVQTRKTALLHKYINSACTRFDVEPLSYKECDTCTYFGRNNGITRKGSSILNVVMMTNCVRVCGFDGSVCVGVVAKGGDQSFCSIYDILVFFCRELNENIFDYETIQFGNSAMSTMTILRFIKNQESARFFTKMYMDAVGTYSLEGKFHSTVGSGM